MLDLACWAQHLLHHLRNKRLLLVEPVVLQKLRSSHNLVWEPHLQLVKAEIKIEGIIYCLSLLWTASAKLRSSEEPSVMIQNVHRDPDYSCRSHHSRRSAIICFIWLGHNEQVQAAGQAGVTAAVAAPTWARGGQKI